MSKTGIQLQRVGRAGDSIPVVVNHRDLVFEHQVAAQPAGHAGQYGTEDAQAQANRHDQRDRIGNTQVPVGEGDRNQRNGSNEVAPACAASANAGNGQQFDGAGYTGNRAHDKAGAGQPQGKTRPEIVTGKKPGQINGYHGQQKGNRKGDQHGMDRMTGNGHSRFKIVVGARLGRHGARSWSGCAGKVITPAVIAVLTMLMTGCGEATVSALVPAGQAAAEIARITWVMIAATLVLMVVMSLLGLHAVYRRSEGPVGPSARAVILAGGVIVPTVVLLALLVYGVRSGDAMLPIGEPAVEVRVTAHQWWWQFEYSDADGNSIFTANELHLPVGEAIDIVVESNDVIHSFWVPALGGKIDAMPGRANRMRLRPTEVGQFRGQCAEFCGAQHARMAFDVQVHPVDEFQALIGTMSGLDRSASGPTEGHQAFVRHCVECHSRQTGHDQDGGPNLARLPERPWLGAGTVSNTPENLRHWIVGHQALKPGNRMPDHSDLDDDTIEALARYLEAQ